MSLDGVKSGFVTILKEDETVVGNGFLTQGSLVVTCAHVIAEIFDDVTGEQADAPSGWIKIQFRDVDKRPKREARVRSDGWYPEADCQDGLSDVAVLELASKPPDASSEISPAKGSIQRDEVRLRPYVPSKGAARPIKGQLDEANEFGKLTLKGSNDFHQFIEPGCSGAPVFTSNGEQVVGIIEMRDRSVEEALLIPAKALWTALLNIEDDSQHKQISRLVSILRSEGLKQTEIDALENRYVDRQIQFANLLIIILKQEIPVERVYAAFDVAEERAAGLLGNIENIPGEISNATRDLKLEAEAALEALDLPRAEHLFEQIKRERKNALGRAIAESAEASADQARVSMAALDHEKASRLFREAADTTGLSLDLRWRYLMCQADAVFERGLYFPEPQPFELSIRIYRDECIPISPTALDRAATQNKLGLALLRLGERESSTTQLEEAVNMFHLALKERTREQAPLDWAATQNNLGNALWRLGERDSSTARLQGAVTAFKLALEEWTRSNVPLDWAAIQNNLGNALWSLGERDIGTTRLEEAVQAFRLALEERARSRVPLDWATTQNNLGNALFRLGEREANAARLKEAIAAYRSALEEWTRDRVPLDWAIGQNNLGLTSMALGKLENSTAWLEEAVSAIQLALEEWTRDRVPLDWAMAQDNLGQAFWLLGERKNDTEQQKKAVAMLKLALEERTRDRVPLDWATTQNNLGIAYCGFGERETDTEQLLKAVEAFRLSLDERTHDRVPLDWAATQKNLGNALWRIGERESGTARLEEALASVQKSDRVYREAGYFHYSQYFESRIAKISELIKFRSAM